MGMYSRAINSDRCPDWLAAMAVLVPIMVGIFAPLTVIAMAVRS